MRGTFSKRLKRFPLRGRDLRAPALKGLQVDCNRNAKKPLFSRTYVNWGGGGGSKMGQMWTKKTLIQKI